MDRRGFLQILASALVGSTLDPEQLLWVPTKTIFLPPADGWTHAGPNPNIGKLIAEAWLKIIREHPVDNQWDTDWKSFLATTLGD